MMADITLDKALADFTTLRAGRKEYESEWSNVNDYLMPGRGTYDNVTTPASRKLVAYKAINDMADDAANVLVTGIQNGLIPSSKPWLVAKWEKDELKQVRDLVLWLSKAVSEFNMLLNKSNFYTSNSRAFKELVTYNTTSMFVNSNTDDAPFSFNRPMLGEWVYDTDFQDRPILFMRMYFKTPKSLKDEFGSVPEFVTTAAQQSATNRNQFIPILDCVYKQSWYDFSYVHKIWVMGTAGQGITDANLYNFVKERGELLLFKNGYYEFPYAITLWDQIGDDKYGIGPGIKSVREIRRLQEMEKAMRLAAHKDSDPPVAAPSYMQGMLNRHPGGENYYRSPQDKITSVYDRAFSYEGIAKVIERVEETIRRKFFNDVFFTTARNPNATPLKAAEVHVRDDEKIARLGSAISRLIPSFLIPQLDRAFAVALRKGYITPPPKEYEAFIQDKGGKFNFEFISPLAQAQKLVGVRSVQDFMAMIGNAASVTPKAMHKLDIFKAIDEFGEASGTPPHIIVPTDIAEKTWQQEQQMNQQMQQRAMQMEEAKAQADIGLISAQDQKARAEGGQALTESILMRNELGLI